MPDFSQFRALTFDCYGTLIDWETGISNALQPVFTAHYVTMEPERALELYGELEAAAEQAPYQEYGSILRTVLFGIGTRLGFTPTRFELDTFATSVKDWPAFPDSAQALRALKTKYRLGILSNIDDELLAHSAVKLGVTFDWVVTAQQARSYKPSHNNFEMALERLGLPREQILHVAQSLYHDIVPAKALGLSTVWVNRRHDRPGSGATPPAQAQPDLEVPDLRSLAVLMGLI